MKICYFGIYNPEFGRNKVYMDGLRANGHVIVECRDASRGLAKFWRLWRRHNAVMREGGYDAMIVGYPGHLVVPFAKMLSKKPVVFDALSTLHEGEVISRGKYKNNFLKRAWINFIDEGVVKAADAILVETEAQKDYFVRRFDNDPAKIFRVWTGADETVFRPDPSVKKHPTFTAVFRGKFLPEAGVGYIVKAAKLLEGKGVNFLIIGNGHLERDIKSMIAVLKPSNIEWLSANLSFEELVKKLLECHVSLGQFEKHERLERTIPHKAFEAMAMGLPYITGRAAAVAELLRDGETCLMTDLASPEDIAAKIMRLKDSPELATKLAKNGRTLFEDKLTAKRLALDIVNAIPSRI